MDNRMVIGDNKEGGIVELWKWKWTLKGIGGPGTQQHHNGDYTTNKSK
jgi:hypothetical protein